MLKRRTQSDLCNCIPIIPYFYNFLELNIWTSSGIGMSLFIYLECSYIPICFATRSFKAVTCCGMRAKFTLCSLCNAFIKVARKLDDGTGLLKLVEKYLLDWNDRMNEKCWAKRTESESTQQKAISVLSWTGPEGSRRLRLPDFKTIGTLSGKVVSLTHRPSLPPGDIPGTHFCSRLS